MPEKKLKKRKVQRDKTAASAEQTICTITKSGIIQPDTNLREIQIAKTPPLFNNSAFYKKYKKYKEIALNAFRSQKVFSIIGGRFSTIRLELRRRGWIEKLIPTQLDHLQKLSQHSLLKSAKHGNDYEKAVLTQMLQDCPPTFVWQTRRYRDLLSDQYFPFRNRIKRDHAIDFTQKEGLRNCAVQFHWFYQENFAEMRTPRCYCLNNQENIAEFLKNYRLTVCVAFLIYILDNDEILIPKATGSVNVISIDYAIGYIKEQIRIKNNEDLDDQNVDAFSGKLEWMKFYTYYKELIKGEGKFLGHASPFTITYIRTIQTTIELVYTHWPEMKSDGYRNVWILKPSNLSQGIGIRIFDNDAEILNYVEKNADQVHVVQKYIGMFLCLFLIL